MEQGAEDWISTFAINLLAPATLIRYIVPYMPAGSHIVNIGSMGGFQGSVKFKGLTSYSASKAALANLTETLAVELEGRGMLQNAFPEYKSPVHPGVMAEFIVHFSRTANRLMNGKVIPVAISTP